MGLKDLLFLGKKSANKTKIIQVTPTTQGLPREFYPLLNSLSNLNNNDKLILFYNVVPEVNAIITYIAQIAANLEIKHVYKQSNGKEKEVKNSPILELLENPNEFENGQTLLLNAFTYYFVTGNVYLNMLKPVGFDLPSKLYCLPSNKIYPITNQSSEPFGVPKFGNDPRLNEITKYNWDLTGRFIGIEPSEMFHFKDSSLSSWIVGTSRLSAAIDSIESLRALNDTINTILSKGGALGFLKRNKKQGEIDSVIPDDERKRIENYFYSYGGNAGKLPYFLTSEDLNFQRVLSQMSDFLPIEIKNSEFKTLCRVLGGFPDVLLTATDTTFANMQTAQRLLYQNIVMPLVNSFYEGLSQAFGLDKLNQEIEVCWDEVEALREDVKAVAEAQKAQDELARARYDANEITLNDKLDSMGLPEVANGNSYKSDIPTSMETLAQKIGVGGTQALQSILADFNMSSEQKYYSLIYLFGLDETQAKNLSGYGKETPIVEPIPLTNDSPTA